MNVLQLIIKDFKANWLYQLLSMGVLFALSTAYAYQSFSAINNSATPEDTYIPIESELYIIAMVLSSGFVSILFFVVDEIYQFTITFASLPVNRSQLVKSKYGGSFLQIILALFVHFLAIQLIALFVGYSAHPSLDVLFNFDFWLGACVFLIFYYCLIYPFLFRFGLIKGAIILCSIQFVSLIIIIALAINFGGSFNFPAYIGQLLSAFFSQSESMVILELIGLFTLLVIGSIQLSTKLYQNKDL